MWEERWPVTIWSVNPTIEEVVEAVGEAFVSLIVLNSGGLVELLCHLFSERKMHNLAAGVVLELEPWFPLRLHDALDHRWVIVGSGR